ncbi:LacI family DNA-binding transcriptional regulator [Plantibacter sp. Mn2098]|uniref:LacI family DNA-binding transcriptional regulator n=1 Tax=Plantibacter sp. Mn2098 TaxID=3395266 RepID=UPI003BD1DE3C
MSDRSAGGVGKAPRLEDVAQLAKVSKATAARALNGSDLVTTSTRDRVLTAANALNYRVNGLARAMSAGESRTIGLVIADISNSFFDRATRAIIDTAAKHDYQVLVINTDDNLDAEAQAVRVLLEKRVDGMIVVPSSRTKYGHLISSTGPLIPLVLLDRRIPDLTVGTVTTDDYSSAVEAVRLFASRGHTRLGMLVNSADHREVDGDDPNGTVSTIFDRVSGFRAGLAEFDLLDEPTWIRYSRHDHRHAVSVARELLSTPGGPTAILTTNADAALAVIDACNELHLALGGKIGLVSFDDAPWAQVFRPSISVVDRPVYALGQAAVETLLAQLQNRGAPVRSREMRNTLIDRDSVGYVGPPVPPHRSAPDSGDLSPSG